jgi:tetratricopeptide (TPR) repeat protein/transcriptional regulator with XRE-family HTH domain
MARPSGEPDTFGDLLRYLRRRTKLTQREFGALVGYSEGQICRLEQSQRRPDPTTVAALFLPALGLTDEPRLAARLLELADTARTGAEGSSVPAPPPYLVERTGALTVLRARLEAERCVVLCGLPGMGKTSLAATLARDWPGGVFWLTLDPSGSGPEESISSLVRRLARHAASRGRGQARRLLEAGNGHEPALPREEQLRLLTDVLDADPPLICLDNAQVLHDNPRIVTFVAHLAAASSAPILLVSREELPLPGTSVVRLGGMSGTEARGLIERLGGRLPDAVADRLVARTGGSPMLLRLALGQLRSESGAPDPARLVERLETQPEVASFLMDTTLDGLGADSQRLVGLLSVFRGPVDLHDEELVGLAQAADGPYDLLEAIAELRRRQLIDHPALATLHPLVHDHVYAHLVADVARRRRLHAVAAAWSERAGDDPLEAAWHYLRAGSPDEAADLLVLHTRTLLRRGQAAEAAELAAEVLRRDLPPEDRRSLLVARGDLLAGTDHAGDAEAAYRQALDGAAGAPATVSAQITWRLSESLLLRGQVYDARDLCRRAAASLGEGDTVIQAQLAAIECQAHLMLGDHDDAIAVGERALELALTMTTVSPTIAAEVEARVHATLGIVHRIRRERVAAEDHLRRSAAAARAVGMPRLAIRSTYNIGALLAENGQLDAAVATLTGILPEIRETADSHNLGRVLQGLGMVRYMQGQGDAALALFDEGRDVNARLADVQAVAACENGVALALLAVGRSAEAREVAERMLEDTARTGERIARANYLDTLGNVALVEGDENAVPVLTEARELAAEIHGAPYVLAVLDLHLALAHASGGRLEEARRMVASVPREDMGDLVLERLYAEGVLALLHGDADEGLEHATTMAVKAGEQGYGRYALAARRLAAAAEAAREKGEPPAAAAVVGLLWTETATAALDLAG